MGGAPGCAAYWTYFDPNDWVGKTDPKPTPTPQPERNEDDDMIVNLQGQEKSHNAGAYVTKDGKAYWLGQDAANAPRLTNPAAGKFLTIYPLGN